MLIQSDYNTVQQSKISDTWSSFNYYHLFPSPNNSPSFLITTNLFPFSTALQFQNCYRLVYKVFMGCPTQMDLYTILQYKLNTQESREITEEGTEWLLKFGEQDDCFAILCSLYNRGVSFKKLWQYGYINNACIKTTSIDIPVWMAEILQGHSHR